MPSLQLLACSLALTAGSSSLAAPSFQGNGASQKDVSRELARFVDEHFADQNGSGDPAELARRKQAREQRVLEIVAAGQLATLEDWDHAAVVLSYSDDQEQVLLGHALVIRPAIADVSAARQLLAFALDHYLTSLGPTMFGTDKLEPTAGGVLKLDSTGEPLPESIRRWFALGPLKDRTKKAGKKPSAKELAKMLEDAQGSDGATWLPRLREIVASGAVESQKDLAVAARLLMQSKEANDLLFAHVLALCAAFEKHPDGQRLAIESLDRYLLTTGRGQLFGTAKNPEGQIVSPVKLAPEVVLRGYGLEAAPPKSR